MWAVTREALYLLTTTFRALGRNHAEHHLTGAVPTPTPSRGRLRRTDCRYIGAAEIPAPQEACNER